MGEVKNPRISVVVPCYNIAGYVQRCLDSLATQTHPDFEVVLVDDGSTDETGRLLDAQAEKDPRFRVFHQEHQGAAVARNCGLAESRTPLIAFVDGDDYVSTRFLEVLECLMETHGSDIACCRLVEVQPGVAVRIAGDDNVVASALRESRVVDGATIMELCVRDEMHISTCGKLFRREILQQHPFPAGRLYEDLWIFGPLVADVKHAAISDMSLYWYVARPDSSTRGRCASIKRFWDLRESALKFEECFASQLGLGHATDSPDYCVRLTHHLCGQLETLKKTQCDEQLRDDLSAMVREELLATYMLALSRGVSRLHPQLLRTAVLLRFPAMHDAVMSAYRSIANRCNTPKK